MSYYSVLTNIIIKPISIQYFSTNFTLIAQLDNCLGCLETSGYPYLSQDRQNRLLGGLICEGEFQDTHHRFGQF